MPCLYIDPFSLACPKIEEGEQKFQHFLENIIRIKEVLNSPIIKLHLPSETAEILWITDSYPVWNTVETFLKTFGIDYIQTKDINEIVTSILNQILSMESKYGIQEMLVENISINPNNHLNERCDNFKRIYEKLFGLALISTKIDLTDINEQLMLTGGLIEDSSDISFSGKVSLLKGNENTSHLVLPIELNNTIQHYNRMSSISDIFDPVKLWISSNDTKHYFKALELTVNELQYTCESSPLKWYFHKNFLNSANENSFLHDPLKAKKILRVMAETILDQNNRDTHALRTGSGGNAPQKKRNRDLAWRRNIDYSNRLHYWKTANNEIEFASIVVHEDFSIPI